MVYYIVSGVLLMFFWCPCMAINVSVQYNSGLLPTLESFGTVFKGQTKPSDFFGGQMFCGGSR